MFAAFDWHELMMKVQMGAVLGGIGGLCAGLIGYLTRKLEDPKQAEFEAGERARILGKANSVKRTSGLPPLALVLTVMFVSTFAVNPSLVTGCLRRGGDEVRPDAPSGKSKPDVTIADYGRYRFQGSIRVVPASKTPGDVTVVRDNNNLILLEQTDRIPCQVGEVWGMRLRTSVVLTNQPYTVRHEMHHPAFKQPDGSVITKSVREFQVPPGAVPDPFNGWFFLKGYEYELVPGEWSLVVFIDDAEVARKTFHIQKYQPGTK